MTVVLIKLIIFVIGFRKQEEPQLILSQKQSECWFTSRALILSRDLRLARQTEHIEI